MSAVPDRVPMLWPAEAAWSTIDALAVLDGTPFNTLVVKKVTSELKTAAARRGLNVLAIDEFQQHGVVPVADPVWPGVKTGRNGEAEAGPTGPPWVDSNGWRCQLAAAKNPGKQVWVVAEPPADTVISTPAYQVAAADAEAHGGQWVVALEPALWEALLARNTRAMEVWKSVARTAAHFQARRSWREGRTLARFGIISDFEGPNEFISHEILNLAPRRNLSCRIIDLSRWNEPPLEGLRGVLWAQEKPPAGEALKTLLAFASAGNIVILPFSAASLGSGAVLPHKTLYKVFAHGKGRIAIAPGEWSDPYTVVADSQLLLSHRHDVFRIFNGGAMNVRCAEGANGGAVVHVVNYTGRSAGDPITVYIAKPYRTARWTDLSRTGVEPLKITRVADGVEVHLPPFAAYAAVEFGG